MELFVLTLLFSSTTIKANAIGESNPFERIDSDIQGCDWWDFAQNPDYNGQNHQQVETYCNRSLLLLNNKQFERAIFNFTKAIEFNPSYLESYLLQGVL